MFWPLIFACLIVLALGMSKSKSAEDEQFVWTPAVSISYLLSLWTIADTPLSACYRKTNRFSTIASRKSCSLMMRSLASSKSSRKALVTTCLTWSRSLSWSSLTRCSMASRSSGRRPWTMIRMPSGLPKATRWVSRTSAVSFRTFTRLLERMNQLKLKR